MDETTERRITEALVKNLLSKHKIPTKLLNVDEISVLNI